jgi:hypothetical protein
MTNRPCLESLEGRQLMSLGAELPGTINTTHLIEFQSVNARSINGTSVVVWIDHTNGTAHYDIRAQRMVNGTKLGPELVVSAATMVEDQPAVAMDSHGDFVVAWREVGPSGDTNVLAQRFNFNGTRIGGIVPVGTGTSREHDPSVAMDARGDFVVAYTRDTSNNNPQVFAKLYNVNNQLVNVDNVAVTTVPEDHASVAMDARGDFDVAFERTISASFHEIGLSMYDASGNLVDLVGIAGSGFDGEIDSYPSVSMDNSDNAVVAWVHQDNSGNFDVQARRVSAFGATGSVNTFAASHSPFAKPSVALERTGGAYVLVYEGPSLSNEVQVAEVSATDHVSISTVGNRREASVSINPSNQYLITYTSADGANENIRGRLGQL